MATPVIIILLSFLGLLATVLFGFYISRVGAVNAWRTEAEAQKARAERLETELESIAARVTILEQDNARLKDLATGASAIAAFEVLARAMHTETIAAIHALRDCD